MLIAVNPAVSVWPHAASPSMRDDDWTGLAGEIDKERTTEFAAANTR